jgi:hypothetical protein
MSSRLAVFIIKLPLYVIIHYIGTTKLALTLHIKPLGDPVCFVLTVGLLIRLIAIRLLPRDVTVRLWVFVIAR